MEIDVLEGLDGKVDIGLSITPGASCFDLHFCCPLSLLFYLLRDSLPEVLTLFGE